MQRPLACLNGAGDLAGCGRHGRPRSLGLDGERADQGSCGGRGVSYRDAGQGPRRIQALQEQRAARYVGGHQLDGTPALPRGQRVRLGLHLAAWPRVDELRARQQSRNRPAGQLTEFWR
jgi:hypothetical protein